MKCEKISICEVEQHPFEPFIPPHAESLILGTFPTYYSNRRFPFYYSGKDNLFWNIIEEVLNHTFRFDCGEKAAKERKQFLEIQKIGITDMHKICYRINRLSGDEYLYPIVLTDLFKVLEQNLSIKKIILTSRTPLFGALGLLRTYFVQQGKVVEDMQRGTDNVIRGSFVYEDRLIELFVPYSTSRRVLEKKRTSPSELVHMYTQCFK